MQNILQEMKNQPLNNYTSSMLMIFSPNKTTVAIFASNNRTTFILKV